MVRAIQSLYLLSNSLKLSLLLSQSQMSDAHNSEAEQLIQEAEAHQRGCSQLLAEHWLPGSSLQDSASGPDHDTP